tara:strand:+ start:5440 stop:6378 length:939 start_codon:yes stop_codon:yes gene_type:complete
MKYLSNKASICLIIVIYFIYYGYYNYNRITNFATRTIKHLNPVIEDISLVEYDHLLEDKRNGDILNTVHETISRNIFQAFIGRGNMIPLEIQNNIDFLKKNNPSWKYYLITDNNIDDWLKKINDKKYEKLYHEISDDYPAAKIDLLRYLLMKYFGGVYMDIKSTSKRSLDDVISEGTSPGKILVFKWCAFVSPILKLCYWRRGERKYAEEIVQWLLIYPREHHFIDEVLNNIYKKAEYYKNNKNVKQDVYAFTGPDIYTDTIVKLFTENNVTIYNCYVDLEFEYNCLKYEHSRYSKKNHYTENMAKNVKIIS